MLTKLLLIGAYLTKLSLPCLMSCPFPTLKGQGLGTRTVSESYRWYGFGLDIINMYMYIDLSSPFTSYFAFKVLILRVQSDLDILVGFAGGNRCHLPIRCSYWSVEREGGTIGGFSVRNIFPGCTEWRVLLNAHF
jgi:hypothetical protein